MGIGTFIDDAAPAERALRTAPVARLARASAARVDAERRLSPELAAEITAAGFPAHFVPRRWGGSAGTFRQLVDAVAAVGEECVATAWCAALYAAHGRLAAYLPERGQRELWGASPDVRIAAAVVPPAGRAVPEGEGWRIWGEWHYASGVDHADWVLVAVRLEGAGGGPHGHGPGGGTHAAAGGAGGGAHGDEPDGGAHGADRGVPEVRCFAVPCRELVIKDSWHSLGLRGTGSNTVVAAGVLVPRHRSFTLAELDNVREGADRCHAVPHRLVAPLQFAAPVLGAARGAWRHAFAAERAGRPGVRAAVTPEVLARADGEIEAALLLLGAAADRADAGDAGPDAVTRNQRDAALAAELCTTAVDRLFRAGGTRAHLDGDPLQRAWRDLSTGASHATLAFGTAAAAFMAEKAAAFEAGGGATPGGDTGTAPTFDAAPAPAPGAGAVGTSAVAPRAATPLTTGDAR
ncbi:hypothetical protein AQI95_11690 [Streptomyces yokosukanensis]|uniref:Acyl-CoA dehydrogenase C-terminal domain-containing protein n=1 Tax=Streptomyces yokosukanensis TaxID=67386 RepID=A0A117Q3L8_9ACTN|nr:hypothetical protein [Streptomyces yokosukanensis]KUN07198.1 hypothetical protein AQI95_11690 [Streptomyces yokosukanensis]